MGKVPAEPRRSLPERLFAVDRADHSIAVRILLGVPLPLLLIPLDRLSGAAEPAVIWFVASTAVFLSGWIGGCATGAMATLLAAVILHQQLLPPHADRGWFGSAEMFEFLAFIAAGLIVSWLHGQLRATVRKLDGRRIEARDQARQLEQARAQLEEAQARLELALDSAQVGVWSKELATGRVHWDARVMAMLGVPEDVIASGRFSAFWHAHILPEDAARLAGVDHAAEVQPRHDTVRLRLDDGRLRTIQLTSLLRRHDGAPVELVGTSRDISDEVEAQQQLHLALSRLEIAREATDIGFWRWELDTGRVDWDRRVLNWFELAHVPREALTYEHWRSRLHPEDEARILQAIWAACEDGKPRLLVYRLQLPSGGERHIKSSGVVERDATGRPIAMIGIHQDVTADVVTSRELAAREREVQALNRQLEDRVEERTAALLDALLHAESATRAKAAFLRNISHELRTPLNPILGWSRLLAQAIDDPQHRRHLGHIEAGGRRLLELLDDLIELTSTASEEPVHASVDVAAIVDSALRAIASSATAKGLRVASHVDAAIPRDLSGDAERLSQVLQQLLGNAVKFSERGRVEVRCLLGRTGPGFVQLRFEVEDQGIGIPSDMQQHVFDAFRQVRDTSIARSDGLGIGLALAKRAVERLGGEIGVRSEPDAGSTFWFTARLRHEPRALEDTASERLYG